MCNCQSWFRVNQRRISAVQRWKSYVSQLRKSALNSADSELFVSETALFHSWTALFQRQTARNQRCSALIFLAVKHRIFSSEQRWFRENQGWSFLKQSWSALTFIMFSESALKTSKLWNSAVQRWLPLGLQPGNIINMANNFWHFSTRRSILVAKIFWS